MNVQKKINIINILLAFLYSTSFIIIGLYSFYYINNNNYLLLSLVIESILFLSYVILKNTIYKDINYINKYNQKKLNNIINNKKRYLDKFIKLEKIFENFINTIENTKEQKRLNKILLNLKKEINLYIENDKNKDLLKETKIENEKLEILKNKINQELSKIQ